MRRKVIKKNRASNKSIKTGRRRKSKTAKPKEEPLWDTSLDAKGNFKNLNLTYDLNKIDKLSNKKIKQQQFDGEGTLEVEEEYDLDQIQKLNEGTFEESKPKITQDEGFYVKNLYKKYGENFDKMVMDHKVNKMQWTETQIRKKFNAYRRKFGPIEA